jgi:hypothetical protein
MKLKAICIAAAVAVVSVTGTANAGCIGGAVVGGVAGHFAHHHALAGAAAGCVIGHEMAVHKKKERAAKRAQAQYVREHPQH